MTQLVHGRNDPLLHKQMYKNYAHYIDLKKEEKKQMLPPIDREATKYRKLSNILEATLDHSSRSSLKSQRHLGPQVSSSAVFESKARSLFRNKNSCHSPVDDLLRSERF